MIADTSSSEKYPGGAFIFYKRIKRVPTAGKDRQVVLCWEESGLSWLQVQLREANRRPRFLTFLLVKEGKKTLVVFGTRSSLYRDAAMYFVLSTNVTDGEWISLGHMPLMPPWPAIIVYQGNTDRHLAGLQPQYHWDGMGDCAKDDTKSGFSLTINRRCIRK